MHWIVLAIVAFIGLYTAVNLFLRKDDAARHPYEESRIRGGHELREVGWRPFPNAYGMAADPEKIARLPLESDELPMQEVPFELLDRQDERVREWSDRLPPLEQGEQLRQLQAHEVVPSGRPYIARLTWEAPENFRAPQLVVLRQQQQILIVPRPPERFASDLSEQTIFIIPPEFIEPGEYEVFLSTEDRVNRWTFRAE